MIAVIGLGFVGLTTALGFAHKGYKVYTYDADFEKSKKLKEGFIPFREPFLDEFLNKYKNKRFIICDTIEKVILNTNIVFYCVGTPNKVNGEANLKFLKNAIKNSLKFIKKGEYKTLVVKSTVPPPTAQDIIKPLIEKFNFKIGEEIGLTNNPEFLREGFAWEDFINPDRIVIGESDKKCGEIVEEIYKPFGAPIFRVSLNTAEFIKYLSNTFLSSLISFSNEMSMIADVIGDIDISNSFKILHFDKRWFGMPAKMTNYVYPGCGFGGYCLPKDTLAIYSAAKNKKYNPLMIREILSINDKVKKYTVKRIIKSINKDDYIGILGLSFKPETDDVRDTPANDIIRMLIENGYNKIVAYDPIATNNFRKTYNLSIEYASTFEEVILKCNVVVILTRWQEFREKMNLLNGKKVIDGRYFL